MEWRPITKVPESRRLSLPQGTEKLVAVAVQSGMDGGFHALVDGRRATQIAATFFGQTASQVAGA